MYSTLKQIVTESSKSRANHGKEKSGCFEEYWKFSNEQWNPVPNLWHRTDWQNLLAHGLAPRCLAYCHRESTRIYWFIMMSVMIKCLLDEEIMFTIVLSASVTVQGPLFTCLIYDLLNHERTVLLMFSHHHVLLFLLYISFDFPRIYSHSILPIKQSMHMIGGFSGSTMYTQWPLHLVHLCSLIQPNPTVVP